MLYKGLDEEKVVAFADQEDKFPEIIADLLIRDERKKVRQAVCRNPDLLENLSMTTEEWMALKGRSPEQMVVEGRKCIAQILRKAGAAERELRPEEIEGIKNMALNIHDPEVIEALLPWADRNQKIASELTWNPSLTEEQKGQLMSMIIRHIEQDSQWMNVLCNWVARGYEQGTYEGERIEDLIRQALQPIPSESPLRKRIEGSILLIPNKSNNNNIAPEAKKMKPQKRSRHERREKRAQEAEKRLIYLAELQQHLEKEKDSEGLAGNMEAEPAYA